MSDIQRFLVKDSSDEYEFYIEPNELVGLAPENDEGYRDVSLPTIDMKRVHSTIRGYARYAIGAFVNFDLVEIEEMNLEFNLKISGKAGMPVLAESSAEGVFKIQVKCKFPSHE